MRLEDLPKDLQRQVLAKAGEQPRARRTSQHVATGHPRTECILDEVGE